MSHSRPTEGKPKNNTRTLQQLMKEGGTATATQPSSSSSSWNRLTNSNTQRNSFPPMPPNSTTRKLEDSDEDMFTVPDVEAAASVVHSAVTNDPNNNQAGGNNNVIDPQLQTGFPGNNKRRRGRNPVDKEYRRLKRLLRNRVSAQQARERKKVYVNDLESRAKELEDKNSKLEERISTLINENTMLRKVLMNTRPKVDESTEA